MPKNTKKSSINSYGRTKDRRDFYSTKMSHPLFLEILALNGNSFFFSRDICNTVLQNYWSETPPANCHLLTVWDWPESHLLTVWDWPESHLLVSMIYLFKDETRRKRLKKKRRDHVCHHACRRRIGWTYQATTLNIATNPGGHPHSRQLSKIIHCKWT